jgi:hypothetical protein
MKCKALLKLQNCVASMFPQEWWDQQITERGYFFCLSYLPKIFLAVVITLLDEAYYKVACWLNDKGEFPASSEV